MVLMESNSKMNPNTQITYLQRRMKLLSLNCTYQMIADQLGTSRQMVSHAINGNLQSDLAMNILKFIDNLPEPNLKYQNQS